jgi:hypothetical protein
MADPRLSERQAWADGLDQLRQDGVIDGDDQNTLIRHLDEHRSTLEDELKRIVPEYESRIARDGQASADAWLAATARALGERDGAQSRRVVDSLSVVRNAPAE